MGCSVGGSPLSQGMLCPLLGPHKAAGRSQASFTCLRHQKRESPSAFIALQQALYPLGIQSDSGLAPREMSSRCSLAIRSDSALASRVTGQSRVGEVGELRGETHPLRLKNSCL